MLKSCIFLILSCVVIPISAVGTSNLKKADPYPASEIAKIYYSGDVDVPAVSRLISVLMR